MKKLGLCILAFLFVFLFGCAPSAPEKADLHIDSSFKATVNELDLEGLLIYSDTGEMYLDISTPDELYGLSFSWTDNFNIAYRGLTAVTEGDYLPNSSFAQSIKNTLDALREETPPLAEEGEFFTASVNSESGLGKIYTDPKGVIKEIEILAENIKIKLSP
ncbi:MAG: hypothetical protein IJF52_00740 [Clostridia bacterium]|nr:hypothetical protein [Clostridia bacterium]